jgi:hypothetical protein
MLELRKKKFESGEPVMARLKSGVVVNRDAASSVAYYGGNQMMAQQTGSNRYTTGRIRKRRTVTSQDPTEAIALKARTPRKRKTMEAAKTTVGNRKRGMGKSSNRNKRANPTRTEMPRLTGLPQGLETSSSQLFLPTIIWTSQRSLRLKRCRNTMNLERRTRGPRTRPPLPLQVRLRPKVHNHTLSWVDMLPLF